MTDSHGATSQRRPARRPGARAHARTVALALTVVLGTALLLWGSDWLARWGAQSLLARNVQAATGTPTRPSVQLHGTFFLPQVVRGRYDDVEVTVRDLSSGPLHIDAVHAELTGVHLAFHDLLVQNIDPVVIDQSVEKASLSYDDLNRYLSLTGRPLTVKPASTGEVRLTGSVRVLGQTISASADAQLSSADGALAVRPTRLHTDTPVDGAVTALLGQRFTFLVPLDPLPFGQQIDDVQPTSSGLVIRASGHNVVVRP